MLIARAARSVAAATGRFARLAEQAALPPKAEAAASHALDFLAESKMKFVAQEKDLESDEALWALYERWCEFFNQKRDHGEMLRRFKKFKETVWLGVHRTNKASVPYKLPLNKFADGKLLEKRTNRDNRDAMLVRKAGKSSKPAEDVLI
ncbi:hypothetical protein EJB05_03350, partial [Eragrostis curvula]